MSDDPVIEIHPATGDRFDDVATLIGPASPETPACWCLSWRITSAENRQLRGEDRPNRLRGLCAREPAPGLIAYVDGDPAGWCAFGPREDMGRLVRSRTIQEVDDIPVWSIVCFVVAAPFRRKGLAVRMLEGVVDYARSQGAPMLEGYPIDTGGKRVSGSLAFVGTTTMFEAAGFERIEMTSAKSAGCPRWIYRLPLGSQQA